MQRPEGGLGASTERFALLDAEMEVYIPAVPLATADLDAFFIKPKSTRPPARRYVIQGELLQFYLLVHASAENGAGATDARTLSQLSVKVHLSEAGSMKGILTIEKKTSRILDAHPRNTAIVSGSSSAPHVMQLSNGSFLYPLQASMAVKDEYLARLFHITITVTSPISPEQSDLTLDLSNLRASLSATAMVDRSPSRTLVVEVELQQPLHVAFTRVPTSARTVVRVSAENRHPSLALTLFDLQFLKNYTKLAREAGTKPPELRFTADGSEATHTLSPVPPSRHHKAESSSGASTSGAASATAGGSHVERRVLENLNFKEYFNITLEAENFPIVLAPGDETCFVACIEPLPEAYGKFFELKSRNFDSNVLLTWGTEAAQGRVLSSYDLHWSAPECRDFLLSVTCASPVLRNSVFPVCFTATNLSADTQDLVITIGEQEAAALVRRLTDTAAFLPREASTEVHETPDALQASKRSILCFQHAVELGPVRAASSVSVNVQYVALRDGVAQISDLQIVDKISRRIFKTRQVCEVYVLSPEDWREHESAAARATSSLSASGSPTVVPVAATSVATSVATSAARAARPASSSLPVTLLEDAAVQTPTT